MGYYTYFDLKLKLKKDTPKNIIEFIKFIIKQDSLFTSKKDLLNKMKDEISFLNLKRGLDLFEDGEGLNEPFREKLPFSTLKEEIDGFILESVFNCKNYDNQVKCFLNFIQKYSIDPDYKPLVYYSDLFNYDNSLRCYCYVNNEIVSLKEKEVCETMVKDKICFQLFEEGDDYNYETITRLECLEDLNYFLLKKNILNDPFGRNKTIYIFKNYKLLKKIYIEEFSTVKELLKELENIT